MIVVVTGGHGFIGSHVVRALIARGDSVIDVDIVTAIADPDAHRDADPARYRHLEIDVRDLHPDQIRHVTGDVAPDAILHMAAESHVDTSLGAPERVVSVNVLGTARVLEVARALATPRVLVMSTDEVYGDLGYGASFAAPDSPLRPSSPYSAAKAGADMLVEAYVRSFYLPAWIVRATNCYGPRQSPEKLIPRCVTKVLSGAPAPLYGDGIQMRDWLYVEDCARGVIAVLDRGRPGGVYCLATGSVRPNHSVVRRIADDLGGGVERVPDRPGHDYRYEMTWLHTYEATGWAPTTSFDSGLPATIRWYREHESWWRRMIDRGCRW